jgi:hypothetical protein
MHCRIQLHSVERRSFGFVCRDRMYIYKYSTYIIGAFISIIGASAVFFLFLVKILAYFFVVIVNIVVISKLCV